MLSLHEVDSIFLAKTAERSEAGCGERSKEESGGDYGNNGCSPESAESAKQKRQLRDLLDSKKKRFKDEKSTRSQENKTDRRPTSARSTEKDSDEQKVDEDDLHVSSILSEQEVTSAVAWAANILFHCVDQPLFNVHVRKKARRDTERAQTRAEE